MVENNPSLTNHLRKNIPKFYLQLCLFSLLKNPYFQDLVQNEKELSPLPHSLNWSSKFSIKTLHVPTVVSFSLTLNEQLIFRGDFPCVLLLFDSLSLQRFGIFIFILSGLPFNSVYFFISKTEKKKDS